MTADRNGFGKDSALGRTRAAATGGPFCLAPFTSLHCDQEGNLSACCFNHVQALGRWPRETPLSAWRGDRARQLRKAMARGSPPSGCALCVKQFTAGNTGGALAQMYDRYRVALPKAWKALAGNLARRAGWGNAPAWPRALVLELENTCNLECAMCHGGFSSAIAAKKGLGPAKPGLYGPDFVRDIDPFLRRAREVKFLGGEPFLIPTYYTLWERLAKINPRVVPIVTTNGTVLNQRVKNILERLDFHLVVSMDSLKKERFEAIRKNADFDRVMANLEWFMAYTQRKNTLLTLAVCPMVPNWEEIPSMVTFCNENNLCVFFNTVLEPLELSLLSLEAGELERAARVFQESAGSCSGLKARDNALRLEGLAAQVRSWAHEKKSAPEEGL